MTSAARRLSTSPLGPRAGRGSRPIDRRLVLRGALGAAFVIPVLAACSGLGGGQGAKADNTLRVLAGSEIKDLEPILEDMVAETGCRLDITYQGTLEGTDALVANGSGDFDAAWFPSNYYLSLFDEAADLIDQENSIMSSPVVLGLHADAAGRLGWSADAPPSWDDVVSAVDAGDLTFGMTSPVSSNSGFATLLAAATALSGTGTALTLDDIDAASERLSELSKGQELAAGSSGWLAERFAGDPTVVDGIFNYESVLSSLDVGQPLVAVAPSDGVVTADYPLTLFSGASEETAEAYKTVVDHLTSDEVQERIATETHRRTSVGGPPSAPMTFEVPYPATLNVVQELLRSWFADAKKPSTMYFHIDTSGSMGEENRMEELRVALGVLSGRSAGSETERLLALQPRETLTLVEFAATEKSDFTADLSDDDNADAARDELQQYIDSLMPEGGTAIYDTLRNTLMRAAEDASEETITSVVLFSDGANTDGMYTLDTFLNWYSMEAAVSEIPVFTVAFGEADPEELKQLAEQTGGRMFHGSEDLTTAFREIRGYL